MSLLAFSLENYRAIPVRLPYNFVTQNSGNDVKLYWLAMP